METMATETTDLTALTPSELDERFVAAWAKKGHARSVLDYLQRYEYDHGDLGPYQEAEHAKAMKELGEAQADEKLLDAEFDRRGGWTRYWLVLNHDGHFHRATNCSTTFPTTRWALATDLSGLTEDEMIEATGHQACTVCFPKAPVHPAFIQALLDAQTKEEAKRNANCEASGQYAKNYDGRRYAACHVCGATVSVTSAGNLRSHKTPEAKRAEAKAAADSDPKKIRDIDGSPLRGRYGEIKAVVTAWSELVSDLNWVRGVEQSNPDNGFLPEYRQSVERIAAALAAKLDTTVEDIMGQAEKKLAARKKREARG